MKHWFRSLSILAFLTVLAWAWRSAPPALTRGPYLQNTSATSTTIVCKTSSDGALTLRYGLQQGPPWQYEASSPSGSTHVITLQGLQPDTRYFYELAAGTAVISSGRDHNFTTSPTEKSRAPFRFLCWGDSGTGSSTQLDTAARMEEIVPQPDLALGLGDLVYESGEWENYDPKLFRPYEQLFQRTTFWPTLGNHDVKTQSGAPYFDAFYLPTTSGAPGRPSNTEKYYSFDHGMAHFVCLDSQSSDSDPGGAMYEWCEADLADARARGKRWIFVFMHHPPYSAGTHESDNEGSLITIRENLVPLFEANGVDMVMVGHSHNYERSYLAKNDAILQNHPSDYTKIGSPNGTIYMVSGCGGKTGSGPLDHPLMAVSKGNVAGFNVIDVSYDELHGYFVEKSGVTTDLFAVRKASDTRAPRAPVVRASSASQVEVVFDEPVQSGTGAAGAENTGNYQLSPAVSVQSAKLDSDKRTVTLGTGSLSANELYTLAMQRVADPAGNAVDQVSPFVLEGEGSPGQSGPGVPQGATWRYLKGTAQPHADWAARTFNDSSWAQGQAGFGYGDDDDETVLGDMLNNYVTVYVRTSFTLDDPSIVTDLSLNVSYDDGFVAFLNGTEVARSNVPAGQTYTTTASSSEAAGFEPFDITSFKGALVSGANVLALEGHNSGLGSNDFSLHPELALTVSSGGGGGGGGGGGPPVAVLDCDVTTANAPATIRFSSAGSRDGDGPLASVRWDFGDGSPQVTGASAQHVYDTNGIYTATLMVSDQDGNEAVDTVEIRIHSEGTNPVASLSASSTQVDPGENVTFSSSGSRDSDGGTLYLNWDFGDPASGAGNRSASASPSHVFAAEGTYTVRLTVTDDEGSQDGETTVITVGSGSASAPEAAFSGALASGNPLRLDFQDQSTGDVTTWAWDFGDGGSSTLQSPSHTYGAAGSYMVALTVQGPGGSDSVTQEFQVGSVVSAFAVMASQTNPLQLLFSDESTGNVTAWAWDFGDGGSSSVQNPVHLYAAEGQYTVLLTVTGPNGSDDSEEVVEVGSDPGPDPGGSGGGCAASLGEGPGRSGDPSLPLFLAVALLLAALRRGAAARGRETLLPRARA
jgi:PKD repeat protein